jgi:putative ABC transport system ATP-binding protein
VVNDRNYIARGGNLSGIRSIALFARPNRGPSDGVAIVSNRPTDKTAAAIELRGLTKSYRRGSTTTPVLQGIDLTVRPGECAFLAGPSGSGKTTLLSIVGCILSDDGGAIRVLGEDIQRLARSERAALRLERIGFVFQRFYLIRGLSAVDNVCVPLNLIDMPKRQAYERAMYLLDAFGLADKAKSHPANLSTGQCQRIALARALANDPDLILADEPTASLDAENGQIVMRLLRQLASAHNKTVVVVTHDSRIFSFADRLHLLESGRIVRSQSARELRTNELSEKAPMDVASLDLLAPRLNPMPLKS